MKLITLASCAALFVSAQAQFQASASNIAIDFDTQFAQDLLDLACSKKAVDEDAFRSSDLLKAQITHHERFGARFSYDNYMEGLNKIAQCEAPSPDPFRFTALVERRDEIAHALEQLQQREKDLAQGVSRMLAPYAPADMEFSGSVVIAAASFSCGGFAEGGNFFIDLQCLAGEIEQEIGAVQYLSAHETYHAIQHQFIPKPMQVEADQVANADEARDFIFYNLILEGTASYVADFRDVVGEGRYARFSRDLAQSNYRRLESNFLLFDYLVESLGVGGGAASQRTEDVYDLGFGGQFEELFYYVGAQMAAEIDADYGPAALVCILQLPSENFILAYERALNHGDRLPDSHMLRADTFDAARSLAAQRSEKSRVGECL